jgi:hypothetical protein
MARLVRYLMAWLVALIGLGLLGHERGAAQQEWQIGAIVGLRAGTCIREGPGFSYRAHTRVPEDNWAVMVIDGPRTADGHIWWDTSRRAAGDPSGGTGWVTQDQTDTDCRLPIKEPQLPSPQRPTPNIEIITDLWRRQPAWVKWGVAVLALLGLRTVWRSIGSIVFGLLGALFSATILWIVFDLTRSFWQEAWLTWARMIFGPDVPDLALLLAALPLASWALALLRRWIR